MNSTTTTNIVVHPTCMRQIGEAGAAGGKSRFDLKDYDIGSPERMAETMQRLAEDPNYEVPTDDCPSAEEQATLLASIAERAMQYAAPVETDDPSMMANPPWSGIGQHPGAQNTGPWTCDAKNGVRHLIFLPGEVELLRLSPAGKGFYTTVVTLEDGDEVTYRHHARYEGEYPVMQPVSIKRANGDDWALGRAQIASLVDLILYPSTLLAEETKMVTDEGVNRRVPDPSNSLEAVEGNWEIVSINCWPDRALGPIGLNAHMRNHFDQPGGTPDGLTAEEHEVVGFHAWKYWGCHVVGALPSPPSEVDDVRGDTKVIDYDDLNDDDTNA